VQQPLATQPLSVATPQALVSQQMVEPTTALIFMPHQWPAVPHAQEQNAPMQSVALHRPFVTQLAKGPKRAVFLGQQQ